MNNPQLPWQNPQPGHPARPYSHQPQTHPPQYGQAPGNQHPYQQPGVRSPEPQGYPQAAGGIAVTTRYFPLGFTMALFKPKVLIDGYELPAARWGRTVAPAWPGQHRVHVHVPYWLPSKIGPADTLVDVNPGPAR